MLKSLELFGFKSFADRTLFEFAPGITCVVGPNGSGKSNVVDAMKWILGDQSAKSLRGKEMSDVIFNGSAQRRSSGFAEATLTFDNADGLLPLETDQVSVGRRLYQSGDSEYLLNGSPVRLKDIRDMFMGTGAGTAAYSIIEQGRVDQILQSNPTARRAVFEEAAGISKFKARKEDAERRLERVAQNLLRLTDIVDQVESQLKATRSQATKAARYRELSIELKEKWTGLAADDCRFLTGQLDAMLDETESVDQLQAELQEELAALSLKKSDVEHQLSEIDEQYVGYERGMAAIRQTIASHQSTIRHQHARGQELTKELSRSRRQRFELLMQIEFAAQEIDGIQDRLTQFQDRFAQSKSEVEVRSAELEEITQRAGEKHRAIADLQHQRDKRQKTQAGHQEQLAAQQSQIQSLEQTLERQSQRQHAISEQLEVATQERQARKTTLTDAEAELRVHQHRLTEKQTQQLQLAEQRDQTERQLADFRERRSAAEARLALLTELEKRQDGISLGVRDILQRAESSHYPPWNQVIGLVRDLIDVPMESAPVLEAVLAERAQLIAVRRLQPFLDYLNKGAPAIDGRVGFISLERCPTSPPENA
ncbi:MAG: AAA family ATPase, partial [Planctomycetaceae bacterium]|nr:AAA family ATPase [Planctomycetaceae bacterium]